MEALIALISDIHSNLPALTAVLADIKSLGVERIYCLGDIIGYGPWPGECLDLACGWDFCLMGNHDHAVLLEPGGFNSAAEQAIFWTRQRLEAEPDGEVRRRRWEFLAGLGVHKFESNQLFVHGSPRRPLHEYVFPDDAEVSREKVAAIFDRIPSACFVGHTHMPGLLSSDYQFRSPAELGGRIKLDGRKAVVNIGSVGQPRDRDPRACYAIWNGNEVLWRRVAYDVESMVKAILAAPGLEKFNAHRLRDGR